MTTGDRHIALLLDDLSGGGAQQRTLTLADAFARRGHAVDLVVVQSHGLLLQALPPQVRLVALAPWWKQLPLMGKSKRRAALAASAPALARYLRRNRPHVLLAAANSLHLTALWARSLARVRTRLVMRVSTHVSGSAVNTQRRTRRHWLWQARYVYPRADVVVAVSQGIADDMARLTGLPSQRIVTIYNPVVTPELREKACVPFDHPWFAPGNPPVLLGAGRFVAAKDFPTLIKAFARVRRVRDARLIILGEGKKRAQLEALTHELGVADEMALPGFVANPLPYMARAAVFVLSSAWEGLPGVLIEAMACGCPVVSTDCPSGPAEILDNGTYGQLVPVGDDEALAHAVHAVLEAPPDPEALRTRAAIFSLDRAVDQYLEVLLER